jgi:hypothetical protein
MLYVETPKVACTSIKHFLREVVGGYPLVAHPGTDQTRLDMLVHVRGENPLPPVIAFHGEERDDILTGPGWFRFCVVRNPIERFFAAWRDKVFLCEPGAAAQKFVPTNGKKHVAFAEFYERVMAEDNPISCDPHWRSQLSLLLPEDIRYTNRYDIGSIGALREDLGRHLKGLGCTDELPQLKRYNEGYRISPAGFVTPAVVEGLKQFYRDDFAYFAFPEFDAARFDPAATATVASELTEAIFDRNRFIAACDSAYIEERANGESNARELRREIEAQGARLQQLAEERQRLADAAEQRLGEVQRLTAERIELEERAEAQTTELRRLAAERQELASAAESRLVQLQELTVEVRQLADVAKERMKEIDRLAKECDPVHMSWKRLLVLAANVTRHRLLRR